GPICLREFPATSHLKIKLERFSLHLMVSSQWSARPARQKPSKSYRHLIGKLQVTYRQPYSRQIATKYLTHSGLFGNFPNNPECVSNMSRMCYEAVSNMIFVKSGCLVLKEVFFPWWE